MRPTQPEILRELKHMGFWRARREKSGAAALLLRTAAPRFERWFIARVYSTSTSTAVKVSRSPMASIST